MKITICKIPSMETPLDDCPYLDKQYGVPFCRQGSGGSLAVGTKECPFKIEREID